MPFVTPPNFVAGQVLTEAQLDTLSDDLNALANGSRCRIYNSAAISIPNDTFTMLTFNSERYDINAMHSTATNTGRMTVPTGWGGLYTVGCTLQFAANATGFRGLRLVVNGTTVIAEDLRNAITAVGVGTQMGLSGEYPLVAGDWLEVHVIQTSGAALNVAVAGNKSPEAWCRWSGL